MQFIRRDSVNVTILKMT